MTFKLELWKLSMVEKRWSEEASVYLDMKSQIRHFRESLGFEVHAVAAITQIKHHGIHVEFVVGTSIH